MVCKICGEDNCKKHAFLISNPRLITEFSGSSPPEIFVGRWNYPNVYAGVLSPQEFGDTKEYSSPEVWHEKKLDIAKILSHRQKMIYSRTTTNVKNPSQKIADTIKEMAMSKNSVSAEYKLKKAVMKTDEQDSYVPLIKNTGEVDNIRIQENISIIPKVDYYVNDNEVKSVEAMKELQKLGVGNEELIKLLSAGLLGMKKDRKMVPTRWSITAVDDSLSKEKLKKIKDYPEISDFLVFHAEFVGNHYEFLLMPDKFSFEVIEISLKKQGFWQDHEDFEGRTKYAESVTGAYYANRLALCEYLETHKKQAQCLVMREISKEYYAPLGVGILRETSRDAFSKAPEKFSSLKEALECIQSRISSNISSFKDKSIIMKEFGKQTRLGKFF